jgi:hypothetical protein
LTHTLNSFDRFAMRCTTSRRTHTCLFLAVLAFAAFAANNSSAQTGALPQPNLLGLFPPGGQAGNTVRVKITEQYQLEEAEGLWFSHPGIKATQVMQEKSPYYPEARITPNEFDVTIAANTPLGAYEVRGISRYGLTNARRFVVGAQPETVEVEDNNTIEKANPLEVGQTLNGTFGADYDHFRFAAKKGQTLVLSCMAWRLDSRGDAVLTVFDEKGRELDRVHDSSGFDPVLDFQVPADGNYVVRVHELTYTASGGQGTAPYRLKIDSRPWIDYVEPPFIAANGSTKVTVYGRNLSGKASGRRRYGRDLQMLEMTVNPSQLAAANTLETYCGPTESTLAYRVLRVKTAGGESNAVSLGVVNQVSDQETEPNEAVEKAQPISVPASISARFNRPGDIDGFRFQAKKGEKIWIEVQSQRLHQPTDPAFVVQQLTQDKEGVWKTRDLKTATDVVSPAGNFRIPFASEDAALLFEAPSDGDFRVLVRDEYGAADLTQTLCYRLVLRKPQPTFRALTVGGLTLSSNTSNNRPLKPTTCVVQPGSAAEIVVVAYRTDGFEGEINVTLSPLPPGLTCDTLTMSGGQSMGALLVRAKAGAANWTGAVKIVAEAKWQGNTITQELQNLELLWDSPKDNRTATACRLSSTLMVAIDAGYDHLGRLDTPQRSFKISRGGKVKVPLKFANKLASYTGTLSVSAVNPPARVTAKAVTLTANKQADFELDLLQDVKPGKYTLFFRGEGDVDFEREKEIFDRVTADQKRIGQLSQKATQDYRNASTAKRTADQVLARANTTFNTAKSAQQRAAQADAQIRAALAKAQAQAKKDNTDASKAALVKIQSQAKQTADALTKTNAALKKSDDAIKAAKTTQAETQTAEAAAKQHADKGVALKREIDQQLSRARSVARKVKIKIPVHSDPITLEVVAMPVVYKSPPTQLQVSQGATTETAFTLQREFDFKGAVDVQLQSPVGSKLRFEKNLNIAGGAASGKVKIVADKTLQPGEYDCEWIVKTRINNRSLEDRLPLTIKVMEAAAVAKK